MALKKRGQAAAGMAISIATVAVVLIVVTVVLGQLFNTAASSTASSTVATAAYNNITYYTWQGLTLVAIGLILMAGMGLIFMLTMKR